MTVKEDLKAKVPAFVKDTPEWSVFLKWISQNKVKTRIQLKSKLDTKISDCQTLLKKRSSDMRGGTNNRLTRQCAKRLDFLKLARNKIVKYL